MEDKVYQEPKDMYEAKLNQEIRGTSFYSWVLRVPCGWIYTVKSNSVFVPFCDEFKEY